MPLGRCDTRATSVTLGIFSPRQTQFPSCAVGMGGPLPLASESVYEKSCPEALRRGGHALLCPGRVSQVRWQTVQGRFCGRGHWCCTEEATLSWPGWGMLPAVGAVGCSVSGQGLRACSRVRHGPGRGGLFLGLGRTLPGCRRATLLARLPGLCLPLAGPGERRAWSPSRYLCLLLVTGPCDSLCHSLTESS